MNIRNPNYEFIEVLNVHRAKNLLRSARCVKAGKSKYTILNCTYAKDPLSYAAMLYTTNRHSKEKNIFFNSKIYGSSTLNMIEQSKSRFADIFR